MAPELARRARWKDAPGELLAVVEMPADDLERLPTRPPG